MACCVDSCSLYAVVDLLGGTVSDVNPYPGSPYQQGGAGGQDFLFSQGYPFSGGANSSAGWAGYYGAGYSDGQFDPFLNPPEGHVVPYSGSPHQYYGQPYSQQYAYPRDPYRPYAPYGPGAYGGGFYDPRRYEGNSLGGWSLGLGIASIFANCLYFGIFLGVPAIVLGVKGMRAADEGRATNKGLSIAGLVLGCIGSFISIPFLLLFVVTFLGSL